MTTCPTWCTTQHQTEDDPIATDGVWERLHAHTTGDSPVTTVTCANTTARARVTVEAWDLLSIDAHGVSSALQRPHVHLDVPDRWFTLTASQARALAANLTAAASILEHAERDRPTTTSAAADTPDPHGHR